MSAERFVDGVDDLGPVEHFVLEFAHGVLDLEFVARDADGTGRILDVGDLPHHEGWT